MLDKLVNEWIWLDLQSKYGCCSKVEWPGETADKANFLRKVNEQLPRISRNKSSFEELYPLLVTTLCIRIAMKMVDDFKSRVNWNTTYYRFIRFNICTCIFSILSVSKGVCSNVSPACDKAIRRQVGMISVHFSITRANWKYLYGHFVLWIVFLSKITYQVGTNT